MLMKTNNKINDLYQKISINENKFNGTNETIINVVKESKAEYQKIKNEIKLNTDSLNYTINTNNEKFEKKIEEINY